MLDIYFIDRSEPTGNFVKFYEELQQQLNNITQKEIDDKLDTLKWVYPKEDWSKIDKLTILYRYALLI